MMTGSFNGVVGETSATAAHAPATIGEVVLGDC
jgi:hypothetical protein